MQALFIIIVIIAFVIMIKDFKKLYDEIFKQ